MILIFPPKEDYFGNFKGCFSVELLKLVLYQTNQIKLLENYIYFANPAKNLISQRCHGEIIIYSQLPHTITSLQHHFEAAHLTNHDINWRGHTCEFPVS